MASTMQTAYADGDTRVSKDGTQVAIYDKASNTWNVKNNVGGPTAPVPKAATDEAWKNVADLNANAKTTEHLANQAQYVSGLAQKTGTGGMMGLPIVGGPIADIVGLADPAIADMKHASIGMATSLKAANQRLTQMEMFKNLTAVPGPQMSNKAISETTNDFINLHRLAAAKAAFFSNYVSRMQSDDGALPAWEKWKNENFDSDGNYHAGGVKAAAPASDGGWKYVGPAQ